ncbi:sulfatase [Pelagicoccus sp. SDUM812005]|uniref:sulfatase n=1 Tax=Pelagicoccus sp. SDUM812005 TaxID=3041257 RepID=UPI0028101907|nr:sulfatase [Pelagicoccus sp. SDUM812005]MDQ8181584.1 sulfatase [Pelagicoccus sp. SDUM812005]
MRPKILLLPILLALALHAEAESTLKKNVLLLCIDDLRPELKSFGVDYIHSPNIDRLAASGRAFHRHYVNAPTCGASRYSLLTGQYGSSNNQALFARAKQLEASDASVTPSLPEWFRKNGYTTVSVGKVSHHPGGWGGEDWYDNNILEMPGAWDRQLMPTGQWRHPRGAMHSLADGEIRMGRSFTENKMDAFQSADVDDTSYHDGLIAEAGIHQLKDLAQSDTPFFLAIGLIKPHLPFGSPAKYMEPYRDSELPPIPYPEKPDWRTTWHKSGEFFGQYNHHEQDPRQNSDYADQVRRHYAACVTYADKLVGDILESLEASGKADETIVVLWGDHGWNLGEHAIWGKHNLFEEALRSPLIISLPRMEQAGQKTDAIVETTDIFPTLCELNGLPVPDFVHGESLLPILEDASASGHPAYSYYKNAKTIRTETHRFTLHEDGYAELYDHTSPLKETQNIAEQNPQLVKTYKQLLLQESSLHQTN